MKVLEIYEKGYELVKKIYYYLAHTTNNLYLYNTKLNKFMKQKPPCKDCLKEVMCISILNRKLFRQLSSGYKNATILIMTCEDLRKFITKHKKFERI